MVTPAAACSELPARFTIRPPVSDDGLALSQLIRACPPLDTNSIYCNLLQCSHFSKTASIAEKNGEIWASATGYGLPEQPDTLFVWQIAVHPDARGHGLAQQLLLDIISRARNDQFSYIETTITESNEASWHVFRSLAKRLKAPITHKNHFDSSKHFGGAHDSEVLVKIGPFRKESIR